MAENKKSSIWGSICMMIVLAAIAACAYLYYVGWQYKRQTDAQINMLFMQLASSRQNQTIATAKFESSLVQLNTKLNNLSNDKDEVLLFQVNELVSLANQGIVVYNDIPGAIRLLTYVKNLLTADDDPEFVAFKYALSGDLARLSSLPLVDKVMLNGELDNLTNLVAGLHLTNVAAPNSVVVLSDQDTTKWSKFLNNMKNSLLGLVSVTKTDSDGVSLPKEDAIVIANIKIDLLGAKLALAKNNQNDWQYNLNEVKNLLTKNFSQYENASAAIDEINKLQQVNIDNVHVNIDNTLSELIKLNNLHK